MHEFGPWEANPRMHVKRLDNPPVEAALAADLFTATPKLTPNQGNQGPGERPGDGWAGGRRPRGAVFGEAALAADLIRA